MFRGETRQGSTVPAAGLFPYAIWINVRIPFFNAKARRNFELVTAEQSGRGTPGAEPSYTDEFRCGHY